MESQSYSRQTAKLIARLAELFPEVNGGQMQHCIENMPRLAQRIGTILERDAVFRYGIWQHLPADTPRPFDGARQYLTDQEYTLESFEHLLRDSDCWEDYWYAEGVDEKKIKVSERAGRNSPSLPSDSSRSRSRIFLNARVLTFSRARWSAVSRQQHV